MPVRISSSDRNGRSPSGVPGIGCRTLTGIESGAISFSANANSTSSPGVSPMPRMPPQQTSSPSRFAAFSVATFSATVCVVQSRANRDGAVSRLQWTRASPAAFSFARSASPTSPNDPQQARDVSARMRRIAAEFPPMDKRPLYLTEYNANTMNDVKLDTGANAAFAVKPRPTSAPTCRTPSSSARTARTTCSSRNTSRTAR